MNRGVIIIAFSLSFNLFGQNLSFFSEKIEMTIYDSCFTIYGKYYFLSKSNKEFTTTFYYPFVVNNNYKYPDSIAVWDGNDQSILYSKNKNGVFFAFNTSQKDTAEFTAFYRQKNLINKAVYILTTTQNWNLPLQKAEYVVKLPDSLKVKFISLQPDSIKSDSFCKTYFITKVNFMPLTNLIVEWEKE
ncbi:MAG: hypothetical protein WCE54_06555 [Ignavibacteriaceae bacterium]